MTAFNAEEHGMIRGIWGELETLNHVLRDIQGVLERQEQRARDSETPKTIEPGPHARIMAERRRQGLCLLCGATREMADEQRRTTGAGCYEIDSGLGGMTWMMHSWPEDTPGQ